jgi:hypothetical protein
MVDWKQRGLIGGAALQASDSFRALNEGFVAHDFWKDAFL